MKNHVRILLITLLALVSNSVYAEKAEKVAEAAAEEPVAKEKKELKFQEKKARKIEMLEARLACIKAANNRQEMKACKEQAKKEAKKQKKEKNKAAE